MGLLATLLGFGVEKDTDGKDSSGNPYPKQDTYSDHD